MSGQTHLTNNVPIKNSNAASCFVPKFLPYPKFPSSTRENSLTCLPAQPRPDAEDLIPHRSDDAVIIPLHTLSVILLAPHRLACYSTILPWQTRTLHRVM